MTRSLRAAAALLVTAACSQLPVTGDGVVALEVTQPGSLTLHPGETAQLEAHAYDRNGDEVATTITWSTPDTTITVDETTGLVTAVSDAGSGRVQAAVGTLHSNLITFTLAPPPDQP